MIQTSYCRIYKKEGEFVAFDQNPQSKGVSIVTDQSLSKAIVAWLSKNNHYQAINIIHESSPDGSKAAIIYYEYESEVPKASPDPI